MSAAFLSCSPQKPRAFQHPVSGSAATAAAAVRTRALGETGRGSTRKNPSRSTSSCCSLPCRSIIGCAASSHGRGHQIRGRNWSMGETMVPVIDNRSPGSRNLLVRCWSEQSCDARQSGRETLCGPSMCSRP